MIKNMVGQPIWIGIFIGLFFVGLVSLQPNVFGEHVIVEGEKRAMEGILKTELDAMSPIMLQATSTDGSMTVEITVNIPKEDETMSIDLKFVFAKSGGIVRHINYDLLAMQGEQILLDETGKHNHKGLATHKTMELDSDDPVVLTVTIQGIGIDPPLKGPIGDIVRVTVDGEKIARESTIETERETMVSEMQEKSENLDGGGCLIATATFGSELASQVQQLRELRDNTLLESKSGSAFMIGFNQFYYLFSPTVADWERKNPALKEAVKVTITPLLTTLSILNYVAIDSEAEMLGYGIGIILLNIGMYFLVPTILIVKLRERFSR